MTLFSLMDELYSSVTKEDDTSVSVSNPLNDIPLLIGSFDYDDDVRVSFAPEAQRRTVRYTRRETKQKLQAIQNIKRAVKANDQASERECKATGGCCLHAYSLNGAEMSQARKEVAELMAPYLEQQARLGN